jgi:ABC-type Fe3+-hydroxamate transport system substrate-binding protein
MKQTVFVDQMNRRVTVAERPKRIVSLVPSITELLRYFSLDREVVGITKFCVHPDNWFRSKNRVGGTKNLKLTSIRELNPDLIIGNKEENTESDIDSLAKDLPVWMTDVNNFDDALDMIKGLGTVLRQEAASNRLIDTLNKSYENMGDIGKGKKVIYLIWDEPTYIAGTSTYIGSIIEKLGFVNECQIERYPSIEEVQPAEPDYVFLSSEPFPFKSKHIEKYEKHFPNSKVILVDGEMFSWYGSRMFLASDYFKNQFINKL